MLIKFKYGNVDTWDEAYNSWNRLIRESTKTNEFDEAIKQLGGITKFWSMVVDKVSKEEFINMIIEDNPNLDGALFKGLVESAHVSDWDEKSESSSIHYKNIYDSYYLQNLHIGQTISYGLISKLLDKLSNKPTD